MKRVIIISIVLLTSSLSLSGQNEQFLKLYNQTLEEMDRAEQLQVIEFSGKSLRESFPDRAKDESSLLNRIDKIRQIKLVNVLDTSGKKILQETRSLVKNTPYERMAIMNLSNQIVEVYKAPYGKGGSEYLIIILADYVVKDKKQALICDIVGDITMKDVLQLLYGE